jgi:hypothetical protein
MSDTATLFVIPLVVTIVGAIIGLVVEYWIIQPMRGSKKPPASSHKVSRATSQGRNTMPEIGSYISPGVAPGKQAEGRLFVVDVYYYVLLFLISASAAFASTVILRLVSEEYYYYYANPISILGSVAELIANSDFIFLIICVIMILSGVVLWFLVDSGSELKHAALWKRFPLSVIIGFLGAWLGLVVVPIVLFALLIIFGDKDGLSQNKED